MKSEEIVWCLYFTLNERRVDSQGRLVGFLHMKPRQPSIADEDVMDIQATVMATTTCFEKPDTARNQEEQYLITLKYQAHFDEHHMRVTDISERVSTHIRSTSASCPHKPSALHPVKMPAGNMTVYAHQTPKHHFPVFS